MCIAMYCQPIHACVYILPANTCIYTYTIEYIILPQYRIYIDIPRVGVWTLEGQNSVFEKIALYSADKVIRQYIKNHKKMAS